MCDGRNICYSYSTKKYRPQRRTPFTVFILLGALTILFVVFFNRSYAASDALWKTSEWLETNRIVGGIHDESHEKVSGVRYNFSSVRPKNLEILQRINPPSNTKCFLVICCKGRGLCGGTGDRVRGLTFIASLAIEMHTNLTIHPSYAFGVPQNCDTNIPYLNLVDGAEIPDIKDMFHTNDVVQISSNWERPIRGSPLNEWCTSYQCGNLVHHLLSPPEKILTRALSFADTFLEIWSREMSVVLHVRAGGSQINVHNSTSPAVTWDDGHKSTMPNLILDWASSLRRDLQCKSTLLIISDSASFSYEFTRRAPQGLQVPRCCIAPVHPDRSKVINDAPFQLQQYFDLLLIANANVIFTTTGGFAKLGSSFLTFSEKELVVCHDVRCLENLPKLLKCL